MMNKYLVEVKINLNDFKYVVYKKNKINFIIKT